MKTPFLYDEGEENWLQKYHLGNGGVYLEGYINCDVMGVSALEHPDLVDQNLTTVTDYYARLDGDIHQLPTRRETVCDLIADVSHFAAMPQTADKIIAIQVFEHFTPVAAIRALNHWRGALKVGASLILSVPDMDDTLELIECGNSGFALRHLRGRTGDKWNSHHAWYTRDTLIELLEARGFDRVYQLPNFHFYPAIVVKAIK